MNNKTVVKFGWVQTVALGTALATSLAMVGTSWAAPQKPADKGAKKGGDKRGGRGGGPMRMMKDLNLTDAQKAKVKAIMEVSQPKMKALRDNKALADKDRRTQMMKIRKDDMVKINAILTPDQRTKLAAAQKEMREKMKNRKPGDRPDKPKA